MDAKSATTRPRLSHRVGALVDGFETIVYATAFLLLVAAALLVVIGGIQEVMQAATHKVATLQGGVLVLDRVLMVLIIAEIAATLRAVLVYHQIAAEPFLFTGLIASVRRILAVTAAFEEPHSNQDLNRLLLTGTADRWDRGGNLHDSLQCPARCADGQRRRLTPSAGVSRNAHPGPAATRWSS